MDFDNEDVVFEGQTAQPVLENTKRHFLQIIPDIRWGIPTVAHTLFKLNLLASTIEIDRTQASIASPKKGLRQQESRSKRMEFLESPGCPLAIYMAEYDLACCRLVYLLCNANGHAGWKAFERRIPVCSNLRTNSSKPIHSPSVQSRLNTSSTTQLKEPFMVRVKKLISTSEARARVLDLWSIDKITSTDPKILNESVAALNPYLTRSLMWCLRLNKFHSKMVRNRRLMTVSNSVTSLEGVGNTKNGRKTELDPDKNELNADVINAWMELLQRYHNQNAEGTPKILFLTTDYMTTLCSPDTAFTLNPSLFENQKPVVKTTNKRSYFTPTKQASTMKRRKLNPTDVLKANVELNLKTRNDVEIDDVIVKSNSIESQDTNQQGITAGKGDSELFTSHPLRKIRISAFQLNTGCLHAEERVLEMNANDSTPPRLSNKSNDSPTFLDDASQDSVQITKITNDGIKRASVPIYKTKFPDISLLETFEEQDSSNSKELFSPVEKHDLLQKSLRNTTFPETVDPSEQRETESWLSEQEESQSSPSLSFLHVPSLDRISHFFQKHNISIWNYDRLCLPIHVLTVHWALLIIDVKNRELRLYDPIRTASAQIGRGRIKEHQIVDQPFIPVLNPLGFPLRIIPPKMQPANQRQISLTSRESKRTRDAPKVVTNESKTKNVLDPDSFLPTVDKFSTQLSQSPRLRLSSGWLIFEYIDVLLEFEAQRLLRDQKKVHELNLPWRRIIVEDWPQQNTDRHDCGVVICHYARCLLNEIPEPDFDTNNIEALRIYTALCIQSGKLEVEPD